MDGLNFCAVHLPGVLLPGLLEERQVVLAL